MKRVWNEEKDNLLRRHYPKRDLDWVAGRIGVSKAALKSRAQILGIQSNRHFVGFELSKDYYDMACKRIDAEQR